MFAPSGNGRGVFLQVLGQGSDEFLVGGAAGVIGEAGGPDFFVPVVPGGFDDIADGPLHGGAGAVGQLPGNGGVEFLGDGLGGVAGVVGNGKAKAAVADVLGGDPQGGEELAGGAVFDGDDHGRFLSVFILSGKQHTMDGAGGSRRKYRENPMLSDKFRETGEGHCLLGNPVVKSKGVVLWNRSKD